jgi:hypothetical protein
MRSACFTAAQLREAGCSLTALKSGGYSLEQLRLCGGKAGDIIRECGASAAQLRAAGYSAEDCIACGVSVSDLSHATTLAGHFTRCLLMMSSSYRLQSACVIRAQGRLLHPARAASGAHQRIAGAGGRVHCERAA